MVELEWFIFYNLYSKFESLFRITLFDREFHKRMQFQCSRWLSWMNSGDHFKMLRILTLNDIKYLNLNTTDWVYLILKMIWNDILQSSDHNPRTSTLTKISVWYQLQFFQKMKCLRTLSGRYLHIMTTEIFYRLPECLVWQKIRDTRDSLFNRFFIINKLWWISTCNYQNYFNF